MGEILNDKWKFLTPGSLSRSILDRIGEAFLCFYAPALVNKLIHCSGGEVVNWHNRAADDIWPRSPIACGVTYSVHFSKAGVSNLHRLS